MSGGLPAAFCLLSLILFWAVKYDWGWSVRPTNCWSHWSEQDRMRDDSVRHSCVSWRSSTVQRESAIFWKKGGVGSWNPNLLTCIFSFSFNLFSCLSCSVHLNHLLSPHQNQITKNRDITYKTANNMFCKEKEEECGCSPLKWIVLDLWSLSTSSVM